MSNQKLTCPICENEVVYHGSGQGNGCAGCSNNHWSYSTNMNGSDGSFYGESYSNGYFFESKERREELVCQKKSLLEKSKIKWLFEQSHPELKNEFIEKCNSIIEEYLEQNFSQKPKKRKRSQRRVGLSYLIEPYGFFDHSIDIEWISEKKTCVCDAWICECDIDWCDGFEFRTDLPKYYKEMRFELTQGKWTTRELICHSILKAKQTSIFPEYARRRLRRALFMKAHLPFDVEKIKFA